jgi:apolipoprotein N-acyltransferase
MVATPLTIDRPEPQVAEPALPRSSFPAASFWAIAAVASLHAAYGLAGYWMFGYLLALVQVARLTRGRGSFYFGLAIGFFSAAPQLNCFWTIFGPAAVVLWLVVAFWIGLFVFLANQALIRLGARWGGLLIPFLWTGLEYFRSELYYLKFSWVNFGYAFAGSAFEPLLKWVGMYGLGFLAMGGVVLISGLPPKKAVLMGLRLSLATIVVLFALAYRQMGERVSAPATVSVAGLQLEFPTEQEILTALDRLKGVDLIVLSEYTLDGPVPEKIRTWCRDHAQYLVIGGKDPAPGGNFFDTAFVVGPGGDIVFRQVKSVPIQFFKDGLPAEEQKLWVSPWGKIGFCVCYDLSYSRVTDRLVRQGAQAIIVPTMDVIDWGSWEHRLHARVGLIRAAEYGVPIVRVASSGISQIIDQAGRELATARFPGQGEGISGSIALAGRGTLPFDRGLGPLATCVAAAWFLWGLARGVGGWFRPPEHAANAS